MTKKVTKSDVVGGVTAKKKWCHSVRMTLVMLNYFAIFFLWVYLLILLAFYETNKPSVDICYRLVKMWHFGKSFVLAKLCFTDTNRSKKHLLHQIVLVKRKNFRFLTLSTKFAAITFLQCFYFKVTSAISKNVAIKYRSKIWAFLIIWNAVQQT